MKKAVITGILGQDGAYLAKLLLDKNYEVYGIVRKDNFLNTHRLEYLKIKSKVKLVNVDLLSYSDVLNTIKLLAPDEIYNLASQSSVGKSFYEPYDTYNFNSKSVLNLLEVIRLTNNKIKFFHASSNEIFGNQTKLPVNESTSINPINMYAISKASAYFLVNSYRSNYGIFASSGILFNHESILRDNSFFIKKVVKETVNVKFKLQSNIKLGNLNVKRDFGYAPKFVEAMYLILQNNKADNFIVSSGKSILLRDIVYYVFDKLKVSINKLIIDKELIRKNDIEDIYGTNKKIKTELNWKYDIDFFDVLDEMIEFELNLINQKQFK